MEGNNECWYAGRLKAGGGGDNGGCNGWMASLTQWTSSRRWWRTGKAGVLEPMGSQRVGHDWATEQPHAGSRLRGKESSCSAGATGDVGSAPGWGRSPGGGNGNLLQYSCLGNPIGWRVTVHGVPKSQTRLKRPSMCTHMPYTDGYSKLCGPLFFPFIKGLYSCRVIYFLNLLLEYSCFIYYVVKQQC